MLYQEARVRKEGLQVNGSEQMVNLHVNNQSISDQFVRIMLRSMPFVEIQDSSITLLDWNMQIISKAK
jgi:hypothetical protein